MKSLVRFVSFWLLIIGTVFPAAGSTLGYEVDFLTLGGSRCSSSRCTPLPPGQVRTGTFALDSTALAIDGLVDVSSSFSLINVAPLPTDDSSVVSNTGTVAVAAVVSGGAVTDLFIGVTLRRTVLDSSQTSSFLAGNGLFFQQSSMSFGPFSNTQQLNGTFSITAVPEPGTILGGLFSTALIAAATLRRPPRA